MDRARFAYDMISLVRARLDETSLPADRSVMVEGGCLIGRLMYDIELIYRSEGVGMLVLILFVLLGFWAGSYLVHERRLMCVCGWRCGNECVCISMADIMMG